MPIGIPLYFIQYRLSRVHSGGSQHQTYNRVILFGTGPTVKTSGRFIEGFDAAEFIVESTSATWSFRKQTSIPQMLYAFDKLNVVGDIRYTTPTIRSQLSITSAPMGLQVNEESKVFGSKFLYVDASWGEEVENYNGADSGNNTGVKFYDRDVRLVNNQRNMLDDRATITPTPQPEAITEPQYLEKM